MNLVDAATAGALGLGLAAATGFRVFVPLLILSAAGLGGFVQVADSLAWVATVPALVIFGVAAVAEVLAYFFPGVDHLLDMVATPAALVAGPLAAAAVLGDFSPVVQWSLAIIGGGVAAGAAQGTTTALRLKSAAFTGGLGNVVVATGELVGAVTVTLLALVVPLLAVGVVLALMAVAYRLSRRLLFGRSARAAPPATAAR